MWTATSQPPERWWRWWVARKGCHAQTEWVARRPLANWPKKSMLSIRWMNELKETAITPIQRGFSSWWSAFTALDEADVRKARALGPSPARLRAAAEAEGEAREARAAAAANAVAPPPSR